MRASGGLCAGVPAKPAVKVRGVKRSGNTLKSSRAGNLRPTHVEVYLFRRRPSLRLLLVRRGAGEILPGVWQPVTGRIHPREGALAAAKREVREETGLTPVRWWKLESVVCTLDVASDELRVIPLFAAELAERAAVKLSREHDASRYGTLAGAASLVLWDTQRVALRALKSQILRGGQLADALEIRNRTTPRAGGRKAAGRDRRDR